LYYTSVDLRASADALSPPLQALPDHLVIGPSCSAVIVPIKEHDSRTVTGRMQQNRQQDTEL
jgi:hypothetical protein